LIKNIDLSFFEEKCLQPALPIKKEYPDNSSSKDIVAYGKRDESVGSMQSGDKAVANEGLEEAASAAPMEI
jgi:hypothetical protein